ncbi:MAG: sigma-70 family RNA polymerase sigma factor [Acidobacteriota bacterium]
MPASSSPEITHLLDQWAEGDRAAAGQVVDLLYDELHRLARSAFRRERPGHTLQATAVVHEAYVRLVEQSGVRFVDRRHFVGLAAHVMRRLLVDHARDKGRQKRGGDQRRVTFAELAELGTEEPPDVVAVDEALAGLAEVDPRKARLVELRFFGGVTIDEAADVLGIGRATAVREWRRARAWLYRDLSIDDGASDASG